MCIRRIGATFVRKEMFSEYTKKRPNILHFPICDKMFKNPKKQFYNLGLFNEIGKRIAFDKSISEKRSLPLIRSK